MRRLISTIFTLGLLLVIASWHTEPVFASDLRTQKLANFLFRHNSSLGYLAPVFVAEADKNKLDYRLLPAISGVESTFGQDYIVGTHNAYGWGVGKIPFASWEDGIAKVSEGLAQNYVANGATTIEAIAAIYCPPTWNHWAWAVHTFMTEIENTPVSESAIFEVPESLAPQALPLTI